jgi:hypothetical protein
MGEEAISPIFYPNPENGKPSGVVNVECKNPILYMKHVHKNYKLLNKYIDFIPHRGSLLSKFKPTKEDIERWDYNDINNAVVNICGNTDSNFFALRPQISTKTESLRFGNK